MLRGDAQGGGVPPDNRGISPDNNKFACNYQHQEVMKDMIPEPAALVAKRIFILHSLNRKHVLLTKKKIFNVSFYVFRAYINLAAELGLWVILRSGPYISSELDLGGLPR